MRREEAQRIQACTCTFTEKGLPTTSSAALYVSGLKNGGREEEPAQLVRGVGMGRGGEGVLVWVLAQKVQGIGNVHGAVGGGEVYCASQVNLQPPRKVSMGIHLRREIST